MFIRPKNRYKPFSKLLLKVEKVFNGSSEFIKNLKVNLCLDRYHFVSNWWTYYPSVFVKGFTH